MKNLLGLGIVILLFIVSLMLSACQSAFVSGEMRCRGGFCVRVQMQEPVRFNEPVTVIIGFRTNGDVSGLKVNLERHQPSIQVEGEREWTVDTRAQQDMTVRTTVRFTQEGLFEIIAIVHARTLGAPVADNQYVLITRAGGTVYYSGTPLPITPGPAPTAPPAIRTLLAQPTPTRTPTPVPTPTRAPYP